jgi:hypothetical protein
LQTMYGARLPVPHILCECLATAWDELKYFGEGFLNPITVKSLNTKSILSILKAISLTKDLVRPKRGLAA